MLDSIEKALSTEKSNQSKKFPLQEITFLVLLILKLTELSTLKISWFWVFFPLWIETAIALLVLAYVFVRKYQNAKKLSKAFEQEKQQWKNKNKE